MTHEEIKAGLSAYSDGELPPEVMKEITAHLPGCAECAKVLSELKALSSGVKDSLPSSAPAGLKTRVLARAQKKEPHSHAATALVVVFSAIILVLMAGIVAKKYMPTMFSSIQGMINGAAGQLGGSNK